MVQLVEQILDWDRAARHLIAVAGPPGAGKSTFADELHSRLSAHQPGLSAVLPMDGFHFDDDVLRRRGHHSRKGAPHTYDTGGLLTALARIAADDETAVAVPTFDRDLEIARAGARIIESLARVVIVEGNYLLLDDPDWARVREYFDLTVSIVVPEAVLTDRLLGRWERFGYDLDAGRAKLQENDLPNVRLVVGNSVEADVVIDGPWS